MIRFEHVNKSFGNEQVLIDFNLEIPEGEFLTVIGRSGCGKTTMLRMINGLHTPDSGRVLVQEKNVAETDLITLRRSIGYVIQNKGLFPHMTVSENITYVPVISGKKDKLENRRLAVRLLKTVGLPEEMADRYPSELSGGQQQRVAIARALMTKPAVVLADEPTGNLDSANSSEVIGLLKSCAERFHQTVLVVTHQEEVAQMADRIIRIEDGKYQMEG